MMGALLSSMILFCCRRIKRQTWMRRLGILLSPLQRSRLVHSTENHFSSMEAVAVFVAEAALSAAFDALFGKLSSQDLLKYARRNNVQSEVNQWSELLHGMKYVLDDAEERQMSEEPIKIWLDDLRDLAYDVEDILDEFSTEVLRQKVMAETRASTSKVCKLIHTSCSRFNPRDIKFNVSLGSKMKEITERFEAITRKKEILRLTERATGGSNGVVRERLETTCLVQESQVYGREKDKETLVNELLSSDSNGKPVSVVAIVGMGGLGKTTLAQLVCNEETVSKSFNIKAWVCVSDEFEVLKITVKIIEGFTSSPCDMKDLNSVQKKLKDVLHGKKFLLVLDDVWNENYLQWDALSQPLAAGGLGSKVLITTRNKNVASTAGAVFMHQLKKLKPEECLSLLACHALGENDFSRHPSLQEIGEEIAKKCDGLPLAGKALGGLLRGQFDPREWRRVLNSNMWELPRYRCRILPALRVSYHYLPSHLKRCFAYCAIFPKDYVFDKDDLILWWMAEGILEQSKLVLSNFAEVGNEYFNDLLSRSFFQPITGSSKGSKFVMHDLINDLAMWISGGTILHLLYDKESNDDIKFENLRHLSFMSKFYEVSKRFEKFSLSKGLRTFIAFNQLNGFYCLSSVILDGVITHMKCLRLLCLRGYEIKELPQSISELKQLCHLDMSRTKIRLLPESICGLLNLQVLKLSECDNLIQLPREIRKLINLRLLDIRGTIKLKVMPSGIGRITNLQILSKFIVGEKHGLRLKELKGLSFLRGELSILGLEKVVDVQEARDANLKAKEGLVSLEFEWMEETSGVDKEKQVQILDELQPYTSLRSLEISGYNDKHFPKWVGDCRFTNLETLSLRGCKSVSSLPPFGGLMSLKMLKIMGMHEVKKVGKEFFRITSKSKKTFPSLETLILEEMNGLEEWCWCFGSGEEAKVVFPRLQKMEIRDCPVLVGKLPNHLPLLEELSISKCPNLRDLECRHPSLRKLVVEDCSEAALKTLGDLTSLRRLELGNIRELICMDDGFLSTLGALQELEIGRCGELKSLVRIEKEIKGMVGLQRLTIEGCDELVSFGPMRLPSSLKQIKISECKALQWLPEGLMMDGSSACESALQKLQIWSCPSLTTFPRGRFPDQLVQLEIQECKNLESMPEFSDSIEHLEISNCDHLQNLSGFPASVAFLIIGDLKSLALESIVIEKGMLISSDSENVQNKSPSLECIEIRNVEDTKPELEKVFANCSTSLEWLAIISLNLRRLPENIPSFQSLKHLQIVKCENLMWLPKQIQELACLRSLTINECPNLELLTGQDLPRELECLHVNSCEKMIKGLFDGGLSPLASLIRVVIDGGSPGFNIKQEAPVFLPKLQFLGLGNIGNLENLAAAFQLPSSIQILYIEDCPKLQELPIHLLSSNLGYLSISGCPLLVKRCLDRKGEYWPLLSIIPWFEIDGEDVSGSGVSAKRVGLFDACM